MDPETIGKSIRERRKFLSIDQLNFCSIAGVSQHTLSSIETGNGNPSLKTLLKVLDVLGMELKTEVRKIE